MALNPTPYSERTNKEGYAGYVKEVTLPSGNKYEIVDAGAREKLDTLSEYTQFLGVTTSSVTDGSTASVVTIGGASVTAVKGNIVIVTTTSTEAGKMAQEFIFDGTHWQYFGDISADNLGALAYKDSASSSTKYLTGITLANTSTAAISVTVSYQPAGDVALTETSNTLPLSTTSTTPTNTANYWVYNPADNISITASAPTSTSKNFITGVTGRSMISSITVSAPAANAPTDSIVYASVSNNNLQLLYLVPSKLNAISGTTSDTAITTINAPNINYSGTTRYVKPLTVTRVTDATFTGTTATVTSSGVQKIATVSKSTSSVVTVS